MRGRIAMFKKSFYVLIISIAVAILGIFLLRIHYPIGPVVLLLSLFPIAGLIISKRKIISALPDIIFGLIDTGLLTIPALAGGLFYGVAGAIAGGVIGDAITDSIAGFFEGSISEYLRSKGIEESRESVTTSLGKMAGCLLGSGFVLSIALLFGIQPKFQ